jgi:putative aldouronate transport system substrate-binding protein
MEAPMKKMMLLTVSLVLFVTFVACGTTTTTADNAGGLEALGYQYLDPQAPIVAAKDTVSFNILSSKNALADDYNEMAIMQTLYDMTNVNVNWNNLSESSYTARKNLIMADKDNHPDAIYHAGFSDKEIIQYSTKGVILPIDNYLDYMPNFKAILEERPDIRSILTSPDGHIYSLPRVEEMGLLAYPNLLFLNQVWVAELISTGRITFLTEADLVDGLDLTMAQYQTILQLFKTTDLNHNGKADEIPLSFVYQNWQGNQSDLFAAFGVPENIDHRTIINGDVLFTATMPEFKTATNAIADWVTRGLIDKEAFSQSQDAFLAKGKAAQQKLGSFYWWESETVVTNPQDYIVLNPIIGPSGQQVVGVANNPEISKGNFVVFSKCVYPEILLTYIDRFYDPMISAQINYGPIGIVYEEQLDANGMLVQKPIPSGMTTDELRLKNAPLGLIYLSYEQWETVVNMEPRAKLRLDRLEAYAKPFTFPGATPFPTLSYTLAEINKLATIEMNLYDYVYQSLTEWLLNGGVSDAQWNAYVTALGNIGLDEALDIYQAAYDRYQANQN